MLDNIIFLFIEKLPDNVLSNMIFLIGCIEIVEESEIYFLKLDSHLFFDEPWFYEFWLAVSLASVSFLAGETVNYLMQINCEAI